METSVLGMDTGTEKREDLRVRLVVWNAHMGFASKEAVFLKELRPDIAIIPESARDIGAAGGHWAWDGSRNSQGLGVVSYGDYFVELHRRHDHHLGSAIAVNVTGRQEFFLLAVWARLPYREPVARALKRYRNQLTSGPAVVAGDFNANKAWDRLGRRHNHSDNVDLIERSGLFSAYHHFHSVAPGEEQKSTHYWRYRTEQEKPFHIDYCFVPEPWLKRITAVELGTVPEWIANHRSDHVPMVVDIDLEDAPVRERRPPSMWTRLHSGLVKQPLGAKSSAK